VPIGGKESYIIPLGIVLIIPGVITIGLLFVPESPRWLLQMNQEEKALIALRRLSPHPELANEELAKIKFTIDTEAALARNTEIVDIWRNPVDRRRALLAIGVICSQVASGASFIISMWDIVLSRDYMLMTILVYSTYFFEMAGIDAPFQNTCIMSGVSSFVLIVNGLIITKYGFRRMFLISGMILCGLAQLIMAAVYTAHPGTILTGKVKFILEI
jgi:SP family sugar:H+ symporter-like MFS transporter